MVTGRVIGAGADGTLIVDSPRGPVQVWVRGAYHQVGDTIEVRTEIRPVR